MQCSCLLGLAQTAGTPSPNKATSKPSAEQTKPAAIHATTEEQGERKFRENCSRCHNAPEDLPPRITGTVLLHMRVRASLSEADQKAILRYLAP